MVMVASAGNNGSDGTNIPTFNSIGSPANVPSVIAVGASTNSHFFTEAVSVSGGPATLQKLAANPGDDPYAPYGAYNAPLIDAAAVGDQFACSALPAGSLSHSFVLVQRGPLPRRPAPARFPTRSVTRSMPGRWESSFITTTIRRYRSRAVSPDTASRWR